MEKTEHRCQLFTASVVGDLITSVINQSAERLIKQVLNEVHNIMCMIRWWVCSVCAIREVQATESFVNPVPQTFEIEARLNFSGLRRGLPQILLKLSINVKLWYLFWKIAPYLIVITFVKAFHSFYDDGSSSSIIHSNSSK